MILEIVLFAVLGIIGGVFSGLIPGVHPNVLASLIISFSPFLLSLFSPHVVAVFIIAIAISHTFLSFIPSVFIGAPDEAGTALSVLPGHRLLLEGKGYEAIYLTVIGGLGVILLSIILFPLVLVLLPPLYASIRFYIAWILISILILMVLTEKGNKKTKGLFVFLLSGILGLIALNSPLVSSQHVLFPVFTGLFGISTLIISLLSKFTIPKQETEKINVSRKTSFRGITKGFFSGMIVGLLPAIGAAQAGVLVHQLTKRKNIREFLISLGGINTVAALFSLMALYLISRPRSGVAIAVERVLDVFGFNELILLIATALFAAGIASILTLKFTKYFSSIIQKVNYGKLSLSIIVFLVILVMVLTGLPGLLLLFTSTAIGLLPPLFGVKRTHAMGVLILPVIFWYLGIRPPV